MNQEGFCISYLDQVQSISQSISEMLYSTLHDDIGKRLKIVALLHQWCMVDGDNHIEINVDNFDCFIKCINNSFKNNDDVDTIEISGSLNFDSMKVDIQDNVNKYFKKKEEDYLKHWNRGQLITKYDQGKLSDKSFCVAVKSTSIMEAVNYNSIFSPESEMCGNCCCEQIGGPDCTTNKNVESYRKKQVMVGYALLHLNDNNYELLSNIIDRIYIYPNLNNYEIDFIQYLWDNQDIVKLADNVRLKLAEKFSFLYEKQFLTLCCSILEMQELNNDILSTILNKGKLNVNDLLKFSNNRPHIRKKFNAILYEIYVMSGYNRKLLDIVRLLK